MLDQHEQYSFLCIKRDVKLPIAQLGPAEANAEENDEEKDEAPVILKPRKSKRITQSQIVKERLSGVPKEEKNTAKD